MIVMLVTVVRHTDRATEFVHRLDMAFVIAPLPHDEVAHRTAEAILQEEEDLMTEHARGRHLDVGQEVPQYEVVATIVATEEGPAHLLMVLVDLVHPPTAASPDHLSELVHGQGHRCHREEIETEIILHLETTDAHPLPNQGGLQRTVTATTMAQGAHTNVTNQNDSPMRTTTVLESALVLHRLVCQHIHLVGPPLTPAILALARCIRTVWIV